MPSVYCTWARKWAPRLSCASVGIIFTMGYANNVPVNLNEYKSWFFCDYIQTWQWPTRKPRLLWPLVHILSRFPFINWIVHFCEKILYSVCVRLIHLNSANKVEKLKSLNYLSFCKMKKKKNNRIQVGFERNFFSYLKNHCKRIPWLIRELGVMLYGRQLVLVQFTTAFTVLTKGLFEVRRGTPRVPQTCLDTRHETWRMNF